MTALLLLLASLAAAAEPVLIAQKPEPAPPREIHVSTKAAAAEAPAIARYLMRPTRRGIFIALPVMDTDPNRGITAGVMPIWVVKKPSGEGIAHIHAPSLTYNEHFGPKPTYRYYYYPAEDSTLIVRGSIGKYEREGMGNFDDRSIGGTDWDVTSRAQYEIDASKRFFGIGPNTSRDAETNYKADYLLMRAAVGHPLPKLEVVRLRVSDQFLTEKVSNGPLEGLNGFETSFPGISPENHVQANELRFAAEFDTRDHTTTTTQGAYLEGYTSHAIRGFASSFDYNRQGFDGRYFYDWKGEKRQVTALQIRFEELTGDAPFWLLPSLGGKYNLRAYGEGRYIDRGMSAVNLEHRFTFHSARMAGVVTEFEVAPFIGVGTVFDTPHRMTGKYFRPVLGGALRAVCRPQVVGSVDFGVGQEGVAVFMDINYSF